MDGPEEDGTSNVRAAQRPSDEPTPNQRGLVLLFKHADETVFWFVLNVRCEKFACLIVKKPAALTRPSRADLHSIRLQLFLFCRATKVLIRLSRNAQSLTST